MKPMGQPGPIESCKLNFHWEIGDFFFQGPLMKVTNVKTHFFASGFPITSVCERSLDVIVCQSSNNIFNYYDAYF